MKQLFLFLSLFFAIHANMAQSSFEYRISNPYYETVFSTYEDLNLNFITIGARSLGVGQTNKPLIIEYTKPEDTLIHLVQKTDTIVLLKNVFQKTNGNYLFIGSLGFEGDSGGLYIWERTQTYETVWETYYQLPEPYTFLEVLDYAIDTDSNIVVSGNAYYPLGNTYYTHLYMGKVNITGQLLSYNIPAPYRRSINSALLVKPDGNGYYLIGVSDSDMTLREWIEFDLELNIIDFGLFDWEGALSSTSAKFLQNGNLLIETNYQQDIRLGLFDENFNFIKDTLLTEGNDYVPFLYNGLDFTDPELIWVGSHNDDPYWTSGTNFYHLYLFNSELNFKGMKFYGGDTKYFMMDLNATSDGGCILAGIVRDTVGTVVSDIYINKVSPSDIITNAEETPDPFDMDVGIYPNPVNDKLNIHTARKGLQFRLYSLSGSILISEDIISLSKQMIDVSTLRDGFYFYTITDSDLIIQQGKIIKK